MPVEESSGHDLSQESIRERRRLIYESDDWRRILGGVMYDLPPHPPYDLTRYT